MTKATRPPRVLFVSYWFAPFSTMASIRASKLVAHLMKRGFDVRVLTADATDDDKSLAFDGPREAVTYTKWDRAGHQIDALIDRLRGRHDSSAPSAEAAPTAEPRQTTSQAPSALRSFVRKAYREIIHWPDNRAGWRAHAVAAGQRLIADWRPDVIYATAPPATTLVVADRLARRTNIPWVAELRDLWTDNPYYEHTHLRRILERAWDQRILSRASHIVTVSPGWEQRLAARYGRPVTVAMNGFVASDFPVPPPVAPETTGPLRIVFTGHIYAPYRDPSPLFEALRRLRATAEDVVVEFIGTQDQEIAGIAERHGVTSLVRIRPPVPYRQALEYQLRADVLLHMQWCDPKEYGTVAGKIFDYLGARRPILGIALEDCVVAELVRERKAGLVTNDPDKIAKQVAAWSAQKRAGGVPALPPSASDGLDRAAQFEKVADVLEKVSDLAPLA
jgi:hypothetical protein